MPTQTVAFLRGVDKRHGRVQALSGLDLSLHAGSVTALLGANGAGKTTAIAVLLGLLPPDRGEVEVFASAAGSQAARTRTGVMLQATGLPERLNVAELLALACSGYPRPRGLEASIRLAGLEGLAARRYGALSGGQKRRVQFALALCGAPQLLCLDEPTTGLDLDARQRVWAAIRSLAAEGASVLLTTHYLEEAEALADRVAVLDHGRLVAEGTLDAVRARVSRQRIRCTSRLDPAQVRAWPGVHTAERQDATVEILASDAETVVRRLLAADPDLGGLEVRRAGLAEAFLEITGPVVEEAA